MILNSRKCVVLALLVASGFAALPANADNLYTSQTRARRVDDSSGLLTLLGSVTLPSTALPPGSLGGLGNRIGIFRLSVTANESQTSFVRSTLCLLSSTQTNDNENVTTVSPVAGPFPDGTMVWRIFQSYRPDLTSANCYFNGNAGIFNAVGFQNSDNINSVTAREFSGFYARTRYQSTQVDFITGETKTLAASYSGYEYAPCETSPYSQQCAATRPSDPCAPYVTDPNTGACYDPNASGGGG